MVKCSQDQLKRLGFRKIVNKAKRLAASRGRPLRVMFADEARFGRMNRPRPCWAPPRFIGLADPVSAPVEKVGLAANSAREALT
jgi:hypothetical protein